MTSETRTLCLNFEERRAWGGMQPHNLGQTLTTGQRVWSGVEGGLGTVGTVGVGAGVARIATISGITVPAENFAARTYLNAVGKGEYYSSFSPGTARLNIEIGGRQLFRSANTEGAASFGEFASVQRPATPQHAIQGNALNPTITSNRATHLYQLKTRFGFSVEGVAAPQGVGFPGGNTQVFQVSRPGLPTWRSTTEVPYLGTP